MYTLFCWIVSSLSFALTPPDITEPVHRRSTTSQMPLLSLGMKPITPFRSLFFLEKMPIFPSIRKTHLYLSYGNNNHSKYRCQKHPKKHFKICHESA